MWRIGRQLLPCARFRLLKLGQLTPAVLGPASPAHQRAADKHSSMTAFAHTTATESKAVFCDFPLDRSSHYRDDAQAQARLSSSDEAILVVLNGSTILSEPAVQDSSEALTLSKLSPLREHRSRVQEPLLFLGISDTGAPYFAAQAAEGSEGNVPMDSMSWVDLRKHSGDLTGPDASLAATAHGVLAWHKSCCYSEDSGKEMVPGHAGWARMEDPASKPIYVRLDPAVITVVECNGHILLGSNLKWARGRFSALAGFVEMGESLEQAVCREVCEESGITVSPDALRYVESQPWPFPRSLMIAFRGKIDPCGPNGGPADGSAATLTMSSDARAAAAESGITQQEIQEYLGAQCAPTAKQEDEMADVRWFHWQWVARTQGWLQPPAVPQTDFHIPGPSSLAHRMIKAIVQEQMFWDGAAVPECIIEEGRFKYVLLRVTSADAQHSKLVVRGYNRCEYHNDVLQATKEELQGSPGLDVGVIGGGRILHEPDNKPCVTVFGHSMAFGSALHEVSAVLIRRAFPAYGEDDVAVSYEGY